jgi:hypothetical protein
MSGYWHVHLLPLAPTEGEMVTVCAFASFIILYIEIVPKAPGPALFFGRPRRRQTGRP